MVFLGSSIGAKVLMSVSGLGLWGYLLLHLLGNLQIFAHDKNVFNGYAEFLKGNLALLWTERVVVFGLMALHAWMGIRLTRLNAAARPEHYAERKTLTSTIMSRTMIISGAVVLGFFIYHILHFTVHEVGGASFVTEAVRDLHGARERPDAYVMVRSAFQIPYVVAIYVVGQLLLFAHLLHGSISSLQSLGEYRFFRHPGVRAAARLLAAFICIGNISIPLIIFLGRE
jgi:succinate dehydrogenase / fumarate reductase cytochrome b subunit